MEHLKHAILFSALALAITGASAQNAYKDFYREHQEADAKTVDVGYSRSGTLLIAASHEKMDDGTHGDITVYDAATEKVRYHWDGAPAWSVALSQDGKKMAAFIAFTGLVLTDLTDTTKHRTLFPDKLENVAFKMAFSADGKLLAFGTPKGKVRVVDVATGKMIKELDGNPDERIIVKVAFTDDGKLVAAGGDLLKVWDSKTWKELQSIAPPSGQKNLVSAVAAVSNRVLCSYSHDTYVYDLNTGKQLYTTSLGGFYNAAISADGKLILLTDKQGVFAFNEDISGAELNGQGMPDIEWVALDPSGKKAAFATERQVVTTDMSTLVKLAGKALKE